MIKSSILIILLLATYCSSFKKVKRTVDMTHTLSESVPVWAGDPEFKFTILSRGQIPDWNWYEINKFQMGDHTGTHLDAPAHMYEGGWRTEQIPIENLIGPGVIINVKDKVASNPDYRVVRSDIVSWETKHGRIPENAVVLMNSGWTDRFPNRSAVFNTADPDDSSTYHFPGWHEDAVRMLVEERDVNVVGVDTPSTDYGQSSTFPVHVLLGSKQIPGLENVANLDQVPEKGATIYVAVIKVFDSSGGPARVFATYPGRRLL